MALKLFSPLSWPSSLPILLCTCRASKGDEVWREFEKKEGAAMEFHVMFENRSQETVDASFPSTAAREAAERLNLVGDRTCKVVGPDGDVTHWRVTLLKAWYARSQMDDFSG
jgi:N-acetyl-gamma-glutamylphosphate reductase